MLITPYIRMLDYDWLISVILFYKFRPCIVNLQNFTSRRCICIRFNFCSWYLQNRICLFYPREPHPAKIFGTCRLLTSRSTKRLVSESASNVHKSKCQTTGLQAAVRVKQMMKPSNC